MMKHEPPSFITHASFTPTAISYGFFGRQGGVSCDIYESLNCGLGSDDHRDKVHQNRQLAAEAIGTHPADMASVYQIHSADVVTIDDDFDLTTRPQADGLVTSKEGIALAILTADCTPLIMADEQHGIIGACHAGWRGAATGIIENTIKSMCALGATPPGITVVIGPTIAQESYQVGDDMKQKVIDANPDSLSFFSQDPSEEGKFLFNLPAFAASCATKAGIRHIYDVKRDTYRESQMFFSHRHATHHRQTDTGRQITMICKHKR